MVSDVGITAYRIKDGSDPVRYELGVCMAGGTLFSFFPASSNLRDLVEEVRKQIDIVASIFGNHPSGNNTDYLIDAVPINAIYRDAAHSLSSGERTRLLELL